MSEERTVARAVDELRTRVRRKFDLKVSASLTCEPSVAIHGEKITVRARIFTPGNVDIPTPPVLRCVAIANFGAKPLKEGPPGLNWRDYSVKIASTALLANATNHLTLHFSAESDPLVRCDLPVFTREVVQDAKRKIRGIILKRDTANSIRRARPRSRSR